MPRIALLGCGGFIGSHFLDSVLADPGLRGGRLGLDAGQESAITSAIPPSPSMPATSTPIPRLEERLSRCDVVISLAALCNPSQYNTRGVDVIESNFIQPRRIADICARLGKWLIQFSTSEVYGQTLAHWTGEIRTRRSARRPSTNWTRKPRPCCWAGVRPALELCLRQAIAGALHRGAPPGERPALYPHPALQLPGHAHGLSCPGRDGGRACPGCWPASPPPCWTGGP